MLSYSYLSVPIPVQSGNFTRDCRDFLNVDIRPAYSYLICVLAHPARSFLQYLISLILVKENKIPTWIHAPLSSLSSFFKTFSGSFHSTSLSCMGVDSFSLRFSFFLDFAYFTGHVVHRKKEKNRLSSLRMSRAC